MAFLKRKKGRRRVKASKNSKIQEIRSPYAHRKMQSLKKLPKKAKKTKYSGELKVRYKNQFPLKKWLIIGGSILLILIFLYLTAFTNFFQIKNWKIYGDNIIQENSKFEEFLAVHKGKNLVFLNTGEIEQHIKNQYPEIENLRIKKAYPDTLVMEYLNFPEAANLLNLVEDNQRKFIINEIGLLVQQDYENPNLPYIKLNTEKPLELGQYALQRENLEYILDAIYDYEEIFGMKVLDAEFKSREREIHLKTEREFTIWLDINLTLQEQYSRLKNVLNKLNIYTDSLTYIDLRISSVSGDKVIFRRR
ncbi:cell division protein FtsQ/DivIB [Patescibacteria group bacterium]